MIAVVALQDRNGTSADWTGMPNRKHCDAQYEALSKFSKSKRCCVTITHEGRGEYDARGSKGERKVESEDLKSREECSRKRMRAKSNWRCKHDEPYRLVNV
jgi:hypothetical protein